MKKIKKVNLKKYEGIVQVVNSCNIFMMGV